MPSNFTVTRDNIIASSLRKLGVLGAGDTPSTEDYTNCSQALNVMIKSWMTKGMDLWKVQTVALPLVVGQSTYTIGPTGNLVMDRPLRIISAFIRDANGVDIQLTVDSRNEYQLLGRKDSAGTPNQFYYDPQLGNGVLYLYNVPDTVSKVVYLVCHLPVADINSGTDIPEFPQEWYQALIWGLADEVALEYGVNQNTLAVVAQKAFAYRNDMVDWSVEESSTFFNPDARGMR